jgi:hypothetical protein
MTEFHVLIFSLPVITVKRCLFGLGDIITHDTYHRQTAVSTRVLLFAGKQRPFRGTDGAGLNWKPLSASLFLQASALNLDEGRVPGLDLTLHRRHPLFRLNVFVHDRVQSPLQDRLARRSMDMTLVGGEPVTRGNILVKKSGAYYCTLLERRHS